MTEIILDNIVRLRCTAFDFRDNFHSSGISCYRLNVNLDGTCHVDSLLSTLLHDGSINLSSFTDPVILYSLPLQLRNEGLRHNVNKLLRFPIDGMTECIWYVEILPRYLRHGNDYRHDLFLTS
jgi:hypothetical protein